MRRRQGPAWRRRRARERRRGGFSCSGVASSARGVQASSSSSFIAALCCPCPRSGPALVCRAAKGNSAAPARHRWQGHVALLRAPWRLGAASCARRGPAFDAKWLGMDSFPMIRSKGASPLGSRASTLRVSCLGGRPRARAPTARRGERASLALLASVSELPLAPGRERARERQHTHIRLQPAAIARILHPCARAPQASVRCCAPAQASKNRAASLCAADCERKLRS